MSRVAFLGWTGFDRFSREPLIYAGDGSLLTIARPGSGKSRSVVIPNLIHYEGSMVVVDFKGELTTATAIWRQKMLGQKVIVFDPFRIIDPKYIPVEMAEESEGLKDGEEDS